MDTGPRNRHLLTALGMDVTQLTSIITRSTEKDVSMEREVITICPQRPQDTNLNRGKEFVIIAMAAVRSK